MGAGPRPGALVAGTAVALLAGIAAVGAAPASESGYWWRFQAAEGLPIAPAGVDDGQLYVAADALGPLAVSALRAPLDVDDPASVVVSLVEASVSGEPTITACPTSGWTAPDGAGTFADRPPEDRCAEDGVEGVRAAGRWSFVLPVGRFVDDARIDVVLVPGGDDFEVVFEAPATDAVRTTAPAPEPDPGSQRPAPELPAASPTTIAPAARRPVDLGLTRPPDSFNPGPSSGLAGGPGGAPAQSFERDVDPLPSPELAAAPVPTTGSRAPLALLAVVVIATAWAYRTHAALAASPDHILAQPLRAAGGGALAVAAGAIFDTEGADP